MVVASGSPERVSAHPDLCGRGGIGRRARFRFWCLWRMGSSPFARTKLCGSSSVGRAPPCQGGGRESESRLPLQLPIEACGCNSMVEFQPSKLATWVRFPSPAPGLLVGVLRNSLRSLARRPGKPSLSQAQRTCGSSSVGRAPPCQGGGRESESRLPLHAHH